MTLIFNRREMKERRRVLRRNTTPAEKALWQRLRTKRLNGFLFHRQSSIGRYVADFYCPRLKLVVEVDGLYHDEKAQRKYDDVRKQYLEALGLHVIRFSNEDVLKQIDSVVETLKATTERIVAQLEP